MSWQPIETAPKDGKIILLTGEGRLAAGFWKREYEPEMIADEERWLTLYRKWQLEHCEIDPRFNSASLVRPKPGAPAGPQMLMVPNPKAGQLMSEYWRFIGGSAFEPSVGSDDADSCRDFTPTHWMEIRAP